MAHTVSGKITREPKITQGQNNNGQYTGFFFEISEFIKDRATNQNTYTNYSVALFAKTQASIDFHMQAIQEGAFVVVSCDKLKINIDNVQYPKLVMENAKLDNFSNPNQQGQTQAAPVQQAPQQQPVYNNQVPQQQAQQAAPQYTHQAPVQQQGAGNRPIPQHAPQQQVTQFDDDIPF